MAFSGVVKEGQLERRGQGIVGKWEQEYFRISGDILESFALSDQGHVRPLAQLNIAHIESLSIEEEKRECTFYASGSKIRLRAPDYNEMQEWYNALQNLVLSGGLVGLPATAVKPNGSIRVEKKDMWVQVDQITNLPALGGPSEYIVRCRWSNAREDTGETEPRSATSKDPVSEDCSIRQQVFLDGVDDCQKVLVSVHRMADGRTSLLGQRELHIEEPGVGKGTYYPLIDLRGRQMPTAIRLKLKAAAAAGDSDATGGSKASKSSKNSRAPQSSQALLGSIARRGDIQGRPTPVNSDVWVQIDFVRGMPAGENGETGRYYITANWQGTQASGGRTDEHSATPGAAGSSEECQIKQQVLLKEEPGEHSVVIGLLRMNPGSADGVEDVLLGTTKVSANDPASTKGHLEELLDSDGKKTNIFIKLKLKLVEPRNASKGGSARGNKSAARAGDARREAEVARKRHHTRKSVRGSVATMGDPRPDLSNDELLALTKALDEILKEEHMRVKDVFLTAKYNPNFVDTKDGLIAVEEAHAIMDRIGIPLSADQMAGFSKYYDPEGTGKLDVTELQNGLRRLKRGNLFYDREERSVGSAKNRGPHSRSVSPAPGTRRSFMGPPQAITISEDPVENCLGNIERLLDQMRLRTADLFRSAKYNPKYARSNDETLNADELHKILVMAGMVLPLEECQAVVKSLHAPGSKKITIGQLEQALRAFRRGKDMTLKNSSVSPRSRETNAQHIDRLYHGYQERQEKLLAMQEEQQKEQDDKLQAEILSARGHTRRAEDQYVDPEGTSLRLYEEARSLEYRRLLRQKKQEHEDRIALEKSRVPRARRATSEPRTNAGHRLYALHDEKQALMDEARKARFAEQLREQDKVGMEARARLIRQGENPDNPKRYEELYLEGLASKQKREILKRAKEQKELQEYRDNQVHSKSPRKPADEIERSARLAELFNSAQYIAKKKEDARVHKEQAEMRAIQQSRDQVRQECRNGRSKALDSVKSRVRDASQRVFLSAGAVVRVVEAIIYEFVEKKNNYELLPGQIGTVLRIDSKGDALVQWDLLGERWLLKKNLGKVVVDQEFLHHKHTRHAKCQHRESNGRVISKNQEHDFQYFLDGTEPEKPTGTPREIGFGSQSHRCVTTPSKSTMMAPVEHVISVVNGALAARCGRHHEDPEMLGSVRKNRLDIPLDEILRIYRVARTESDRETRVPEKLMHRESQRLFFDGQLVDMSEGWKQCIEPDVIRQVPDDFDVLFDFAVEAQAELLARVGPEDPDKYDRATLSKMWPAGGRWMNPHASSKALFAYNPGPKSRKDAHVKAFVQFAPSEGPRRYRHLIDLARVGLVYSDAALLNSALDDIIEKFEVCQIRNFYHPNTQNVLGDRFVEVLVILHNDSNLSVPHVCEIRLEELSYFEARERAFPYLRAVQKGFSEIYAPTGRDPAAIEYLVKYVLEYPKKDHRVKIFRRHLAQKWGCITNVWRSLLAPKDQLVSFRKFRDVCCQQAQRENAVRLWQELDASFSGTLSLFELDPHTVILLSKLYARLLVIIHGLNEEMTAETLFAHITHNVPKLHHPDRLEAVEFRQGVKFLGFTPVEADRLFKTFDPEGPKKREAVRHITARDIGWLLKLPLLVDMDAVMLTTASTSDMIRSRLAVWGDRAMDTTLQMQKQPSTPKAQDRRPSLGSISSFGSRSSQDARIEEVNAAGRILAQPGSRAFHVLQPLRCRGQMVPMWEDQHTAAAVLDDMAKLYRAFGSIARLELACGREERDDGSSQIRVDLLKQGLVSRGIPSKIINSAVQGLATQHCNTVLRFLTAQEVASLGTVAAPPFFPDFSLPADAFGTSLEDFDEEEEDDQMFAPKPKVSIAETNGRTVSPKGFGKGHAIRPKAAAVPPIVSIGMSPIDDDDEGDFDPISGDELMDARISPDTGSDPMASTGLLQDSQEGISESGRSPTESEFDFDDEGEGEEEEDNRQTDAELSEHDPGASPGDVMTY